MPLSTARYGSHVGGHVGAYHRKRSSYLNAVISLDRLTEPESPLPTILVINATKNG